MDKEGDRHDVRYDTCKHIRSAVIGLAHALCKDTWQARCCAVIVLVLRNSSCTTVYNKSKLTVAEAHTITLQHPKAFCQLLGKPVGPWHPLFHGLSKMADTVGHDRSLH